MKMFRLDNKVAIVTGGAGLFGKPISMALAEAGAQVIVASRDESKCKEFAASIKSKNLNAEGMFLDLSDENSILEFTKSINDKYGRIDILVNNAVSREGLKDLEEVSKKEWEAAQNINSTGMILLTQAVIKLMRKQRSGNIINIGSIQGSVGPNFPVYGKVKK